MTFLPADPYVDGCNDELVKVGRVVRQSKMLPIAKIVHHMLMWRMKNIGGAVYLRDQWEVTRGLPGAADDHTVYYRTSPTARCVRISILTLGATAGSGDPQLQVDFSSPASTVYSEVINDTAAATFPTFITEHTVKGLVNPDTLETITISQVASTTVVRILAINVQEMPRDQMNTAQDTSGGVFLGIDSNLYQPGTDIIDTDIAPGVLAENTLRRLWKKVLFSNMKHLSTDAGAYECMVCKAGGNLLRWNYYPSVCLPETADPANSITLAVLGVPTSGTGDVRLLTAAGGSINVNFPAAPLQIRTQTTALPRAADTWALQGQATGGATAMDIYGAMAFEGTEAV